MNVTKKIDNCRSCGSQELSPIFSLGNQFLSKFVKTDNSEGFEAPLDLVLCKKCTLLQLRHDAPDNLMWNNEYGYKSGLSSTIKSDLKDIAMNAQKMVSLKEGDLVVDIGCNDGTSLLNYSLPGLITLGFEPSSNVAAEAMSKGLNVINNFFNAKEFSKYSPNKKAKIITAISMFYDLSDPNQFIKDIVSCLDKDGLFIIQQNYLISMLSQNAFDNILHEHREYYSLISLNNLLNKYGLEVFDVALNDINGGSIRTYIRFLGNEKLSQSEEAKQRIADVLETERNLKLDTPEPYKALINRIDDITDKLLTFLQEEKSAGKKIAAYGASTRGNVVLQYFNLDKNLIDFIADKNSDKWGKKTVGTLIPIVSPSEIMQKKPDYLLIMTWHFLEEIMKQEAAFKQAGGKFVVALPNFKVL